MSYTEKVVDFIVSSKKESIPKDVIEHAKIFILDTIGCAIAVGYALPRCTVRSNSDTHKRASFREL